TLLGYVALMMTGSDPQEALGRARLPRGAAALQAHVDSIAALLLGRVGFLPPLARVALAGITAGITWLGWRRTAPNAAGSSWASVLLVGSGGGFVVALLVHPWIPIAIEKTLWYATPLVICLALAALWPSSAALQRLAPVLLAGLLVGCTDADGDGFFAQTNDCNDDSASVYPGAPEVWGDAVDNDCDSVIDDSEDYRFFIEEEPNDTTLSGCFAPDGQGLGDIAAFGLLNRLTGTISSVEDDSYDEGDLDCYQLRFPDDAGHPRLEVRLSWTNPESDLDFAVQGLWEGEQNGFALADQPGPGPEFRLTSAGFDGGESLWVWVVGYSGPPTDYTLDLVLR
ncbi:MAG: putative metal-binding motif-containing protein, partial [Deltaproteobacteria bacterium]|nr:putative metal-binding motif-containing protein [Deltaproteobacteria bacterium]